MRQLSTLELRRLCGHTEYQYQALILDKMNIPHRARTVQGTNYMIGINCYVPDVQKVIGLKAFEAIEDETIGTGLAKL